MISNLDLYRVFYTVGKNGSFSKAAKELFITQPAISQAIKQLEEELETNLFHRTPKGVSLTAEGANLFDYIESAMNLISIGEEQLADFKNLKIGELKIGVGDTISRFFLLPYLEKFHKNYPNIKFKIMNGTTFELISTLKKGEIDIAICNFPINDSSLEQIQCKEIQDTFVYGNDYDEIFSEPIHLKDLSEYPLLLLDPYSNSRQYVEDYLLSQGVRISPEFELGSHDLLLEFAKINLGIACVIREFSQDYLQQGILKEVKFIEGIPKRSIGICYPKNVPLTAASKRFIEIIETNLT